MHKLRLTIILAIREAQANIMHTILSVLGIVIGVAALVVILSMIDGMEKFANDQISKTTSLESIIITTPTTESVDKISMKKDNYVFMDYAAFNNLREEVSVEKIYMLYQESGWLYTTDYTLKQGILMGGIVETTDKDTKVLAGRLFTKQDIEDSLHHAIVNKVLAKKLMEGENEKDVIGKTYYYDNKEVKVVGLVDRKGMEPKMFLPFTCFSNLQLQDRPPQCILMASSIEAVPETKQQAKNWLKEYFGESESDFRVITNEGRVKQAEKAFFVFRIVMGLIVGISVVVGGIGVMNVLLITVSERTTEIGVRKAVGANRKDIITQFLAESVAISTFGSLLGLVFGVLFTLVAVPIIKAITEVPFQAAYTLNTLFIIGAVSLLVGVVFGTYPAIKAAKMNPVEAIRRE